jgi:hypothetical protein
VSQYSPEDISYYFKQFCARQEGVPSFIEEIYHTSLFLE